MAVWLQAKVRECGPGCGLGGTPALSVTNSSAEAAYVACGAIYFIYLFIIKSYTKYIST